MLPVARCADRRCDDCHQSTQVADPGSGEQIAVVGCELSNSINFLD